MSKLAEMIQAVQTSERRRVMSPLVAIRTSSVEPRNCSFPEHYVYTLTATFGCNATLEYNDPCAVQVLAQVRRQVVDEVFGEFRENFTEIERALFNYDNEAARKALNSFRQRMFEV